MFISQILITITTLQMLLVVNQVVKQPIQQAHLKASLISPADDTGQEVEDDEAYRNHSYRPGKNHAPVRVKITSKLQARLPGQLQDSHCLQQHIYTLRIIHIMIHNLKSSYGCHILPGSIQLRKQFQQFFFIHCYSLFRSMSECSLGT